jgi:hypothetical protein
MKSYWNSVSGAWWTAENRRKSAGLCASVAVVLLAAAGSPSLAASGYTLEINGKVYELGLDARQEIVLPDGSRLSVLLSQDEFSTFSTERFSFSHRNEYKPARIDVGSGIHQTMMITPVGNGVLVQEYEGINPELLVGLMIQEITKEEVDYGYEITETEVTQTVGDVVLKGTQAVTSLKDTRWVRTVYAHGAKDSGFLIITMIEDEYRDQDMQVIEDFWRTFEFN